MKNYLLTATLVIAGIISASAAGHTLTLNSLDITCQGACTASSTVVVSGGVGPFGFSWTSLGGFTSTDTTIYNLCPDTYTITVTDSSDMSIATTSFTVTEIPQMVVDLVPNNPTTCGSCDGTIIANISGGTAPYTYQWSTGQTGWQMFQGCPGFYNVYVTDANGCTAQNATQLNNVNPVNIILDSQTNLDCTTPFGTISIHAIGGTGVYNYYWYPGGETTATITNLSEGQYIVYVVDNSGDSCSAWLDFNIINTYNLYASIISTPANCGNIGTAHLEIQGANPPFTCVWSPGGQTTQDLSGLAPGTYTVTITDGVGCSVIGHTTIASTCSNIIQGRVYNDINQNCIQDIGEDGLAGISIYTTPGYFYGYTDANGDYMIETTDMNATVSIGSYVETYFSPTCPADGSLDVSFTNLGETSTGNDFGYWADPNYFDLDLHPGWTSASPGFDKTYWFLYRNNSGVTQNAVVRFIYDPVLTYLSCTQGGVHFPAQHKIEWTYNNLAPGANNWGDWNNRPQAYFNVPSSLSINALLHTDFAMLPITGDAYPQNNVLVLDEPCTGSHDPNSKSVIPEGAGPEGFIFPADSVLFYTIHFQNDGNDTAFTVVLTDTLSQYLDPVSIIPGAASHPYTFSLSEHGIMTFRFDAIMLPDSNINEPASHGYINYTVHLKQDLPTGTVIENTAYIYFDFNDAVITNTTVNTTRLESGIEELDPLVAVYPNPALRSLTVQSGISKGNYYFRDITGKLLLTGTVSSEKFSVDISALSSGVYFISIADGERQVNGKVVKQ